MDLGSSSHATPATCRRGWWRWRRLWWPQCSASAPRNLHGEVDRGWKELYSTAAGEDGSAGEVTIQLSRWKPLARNNLSVIHRSDLSFFEQAFDRAHDPLN